MEINAFLAEKSRRTDEALYKIFDEWQGAPPRLIEAMKYSLFAGGKRFRPALVLGAADLVAGDDTCAIPAACAIEMIHTYSLIHDDLPAMDNDDFRRGKPSCHRAFGEALAILAGDTLVTMAFAVLTRTENLTVIREIAEAAGVCGMAAGQVMDLEAEHQKPSLSRLQSIHAHKTGALIRASVRVGAILAQANPQQLDALTQFGEHLGLAFQITDDILDVVGTPEKLGKPVGGDATKEKATYPSLVGLAESRRLAREAVESAIATLSPFGERADTFRALAHYLLSREN